MQQVGVTHDANAVVLCMLVESECLLKVAAFKRLHKGIRRKQENNASFKA